MKKLLATIAFGIAVLPSLTGAAFAHGCHLDVRQDQFGWHRHARNDCDRIDVQRGYRDRREYGDRDREHEHEHRRHDDDDRPPPPPVCVKKCHYIGPFKECEQVCR